MKNIFWLLAVVVVVGFAWFWLNDSSSPTAEGNIHLGLMFPLTSEYSTVAEGFRNAALLAIADWEEANPGRTVKYTIEDDAYDAAKGIASYNKLKNIDQIDGLVSISTPVVDALYQTYQKDGLPVINFGVQTEGADDDNIFQILPDAKGQIKPLVDHLMEEANYDQIIVVHSTNDVTSGQFYDQFIKLYSRPFTEMSINSVEDSRIVANRVVAANVPAVVFILTPEIGATLTKELKLIDKANMNYYYDSFPINGWNEYKKILGDTNLMNGATLIKAASPDTTEFAASYEERFGVPPSIFADTGYDSTMIMLNTYDSDQSDWIEKIKNISFSGVAGKTTFDENGIRISDYDVVRVIDGEIK